MLYGANDLTIYERYAEEWWQPDSPRFRSLQKVTEFRLQQIDKWFGSVTNKNIVDLGCGGGLLSLPLLKRGAKVTGVDISPASIEVAENVAQGTGRFFCSDVREVPLPSASFDYALLADVLDHLPDYPRALQEAARLLKPGGLLYVNTINKTFRSWLFAILLGEGLGLIPPGTHDWRLFIPHRELIEQAKPHCLSLQSYQGERADIGKTIRNWAITFRPSPSLAIAYSTLFRREGN